MFQYMLLLRGATFWKVTGTRSLSVSIHAPLARSNTPVVSPAVITESFQYMLLLRGATQRVTKLSRKQLFQYMLLLRGATDLIRRHPHPSRVSIHAPLARSNATAVVEGEKLVVSIHAPLARSNSSRVPARRKSFVSIHAPLARSNNLGAIQHFLRRCFNTCSSCEEQLIIARHDKGDGVFQYMLLLRGATGCRA